MITYTNSKKVFANIKIYPKYNGNPTNAVKTNVS